MIYPASAVVTGTHRLMSAVFGNTCLVGEAGSLYIFLGSVTYMMYDRTATLSG